MTLATKGTRRKYSCYFCGQEIFLDSTVRSENGKRIPHNVDGTKHDCPKSPYNIKKRQRESVKEPVA